MRTPAGKLFAAATIALCATLALAQSGNQQPQMTPEQKAEWEAYMKAGTPGAPHQAMASWVGSYALSIKSWHETGGPAMEDTRTATRTIMLGGCVLVEELSSSIEVFEMYGPDKDGREMKTMEITYTKK